MNKGLRDYLDSIGAKPIDPAVMAEYDRAMREECIPKIVAAERANRELVWCHIYHPRGCRCTEPQRM